MPSGKITTKIIHLPTLHSERSRYAVLVDWTICEVNVGLRIKVKSLIYFPLVVTYYNCLNEIWALVNIVRPVSCNVTCSNLQTTRYFWSLPFTLSWTSLLVLFISSLHMWLAHREKQTKESYNYYTASWPPCKKDLPVILLSQRVWTETEQLCPFHRVHWIYKHDSMKPRLTTSY